VVAHSKFLPRSGLVREAPAPGHAELGVMSSSGVAAEGPPRSRTCPRWSRSSQCPAAVGSALDAQAALRSSSVASGERGAFEARGLEERCARECASGLTAADLGYGRESQRFSLPPELAAVLAEQVGAHEGGQHEAKLDSRGGVPTLRGFGNRFDCPRAHGYYR
jgi:hypothetical protein